MRLTGRERERRSQIKPKTSNAASAINAGIQMVLRVRDGWGVIATIGEDAAGAFVDPVIFVSGVGSPDARFGVETELAFAAGCGEGFSGGTDAAA